MSNSETKYRRAVFKDNINDIALYECSKKKCKWRGTMDEKNEKQIEPGYFEKACPNCGNNEFFGLIKN